MQTIEAKILESVLDQAREIAMREEVPLEHIISLAVTQAVTQWKSETPVILRNRRADREKFLDAITEMINFEAANDARPVRCDDDSGRS